MKVPDTSPREVTGDEFIKPWEDKGAFPPAGGKATGSQSPLHAHGWWEPEARALWQTTAQDPDATDQWAAERVPALPAEGGPQKAKQ